MNYLAHALLTSRASSDVQFGNFIADAVKGNPDGKYRPEVVKGIKIHRLIDDTSDHHPSYAALKSMLPDGLKRFSAILGDMYFDFVLARNWSDWNIGTLSEFANNYHGLMDGFLHEMPDRMAYMYGFMRERQWLMSYAKLEGMCSAVEGLANRRPSLERMRPGAEWLISNHSLLPPLLPALLRDVAMHIHDRFGEEIPFSHSEA